MHYSVDKGDLGEVRLNGEIVHFTVECHTTEGWVRAADLPLTVVGGELVTSFLHGEVEFIRYQRGGK